MAKRFKKMVCSYILKILKKHQIKIVSIGGTLGIFGLCTYLVVLFVSQNLNYEYINKPVSISQFNGLSVDSMGNIYIGEGENDLVQVFNENGKFLYGFYAGASQWYVFDIDDQDKLHIGGARGSRHEIYYDGKLESSQDINFEN